MKTTLKMAERKRVLKVKGFHKSLGGFGKKLLTGMGIKKGAKLEIEPAYVSKIVLQFGGKEIQLGYESLLGVVVGDRRLTELTPGELGTISALEVGRGALAKFLALGLKVGTIVDVKNFIPGPGPLFVEVQGAHIAIINVEGFVIAGDELHEYDLPGDVVFVEVKGKEKQLSSMDPREKGKISSIAGNSELKAELERHWIKKGNTIRVLHRQESESHALMVLVKGTCHHIPKGLTEKVYVEVV
jgi:Fe2+ transport system protein FeoA